MAISSEPYISQLEVIEDPEEQLTIADIANEITGWKMLDDIAFFGGYTRDIHWFRLKVQADTPTQAILTLRPPILDNVQLFLPSALVETNATAVATTEASFQRYQQGDLFAYSQREKQWRGFSFALLLPDKQSHFIYLRVKTSSSTVLIPELWSIKAFDNYTSAESLIFGTGVGILLVLAILAALYWSVERDKLFAYFLFFSITTLLFLTTPTGLLGLYILPDWPQFNSNLVGAVTAMHGIASTLFVQQALDVAKISRRINQLFNVAIGFYSLCVGLALAGHWEWIAKIFMLIAMIHIVGSFLIAVVAWRRNVSLARYLVVAFGIVLICRIIPVIGFLGLNLPGRMSFYPALAADLLRMLLLLPVITERAIQMKQMREQAVKEMQYMSVRRDWMAMLTHEIKTPLAVITSSNQNIQMLTHDDDILTRTRKINHGTQRIETIIDSLLHEDLLDIRHRQLDRTQFNLLTLIQQVSNALPNGQTTIQLAVPETLILVADQELIGLTLNNLLSNALKHGPSGQTILLSAEHHALEGVNGILISVHEHGLAITPERRARLFEKYSSFGKNAGSGIGLWACREIAHAHGGDIWLESNQKSLNGNTFCLWLPLN